MLSTLVSFIWWNILRLCCDSLEQKRQSHRDFIVLLLFHQLVCIVMQIDWMGTESWM